MHSFSASASNNTVTMTETRSKSEKAELITLTLAILLFFFLYGAGFSWVFDNTEITKHLTVARLSAAFSVINMLMAYVFASNHQAVRILVMFECIKNFKTFYDLMPVIAAQ